MQLLVGIVALVGIFSALYPDRFATFRNFQNITRQGATLLVVAVGQSFALGPGRIRHLRGCGDGPGQHRGGFGDDRLRPVGRPARRNGGGPGRRSRQRNPDCQAERDALCSDPGDARHSPEGPPTRSVTAPRCLAFRSRFVFLEEVPGVRSPQRSEWRRSSWRLRSGPLPEQAGALPLCNRRLSRRHRLAGVKVARYELLAYAVCGLLAGVGGLMLASRVSVGQASLGQGFELMSIATAVIGGFAVGGGVGRLSGVVCGVALLSVLSTGMNIAQISEFVQQMLTGVVLVAAVLIDRLRRRKGRTASGPGSGEFPAPYPTPIPKP